MTLTNQLYVDDKDISKISRQISVVSKITRVARRGRFLGNTRGRGRASLGQFWSSQFHHFSILDKNMSIIEIYLHVVFKKCAIKIITVAS